MKTKFSILILAALFQFSCSTYIPKPKAYPRVIYPDKAYNKAEVKCPFSFEKPVYSILNPYGDDVNKCWYNLVFTPFDATLHLSYIPITGTKELDSLAEDAYRMVFTPHIQRAEEIIEREISDTSRGLFGMIYDLEGKTATPFNFYLTDGAKHFIRGSFYFNKKTEMDSVMPIYTFLNADIIRALETFQFQ
jgi:gliding motility-associated lipoprotein GldD|tara:strand:- start:91 stop:663 length:573 start_codon:yes stop_codon:yes gene_type:complete